MGEVNTTITLKSASDITRARDGHLAEGDIHSADIEVLADTGALTHLVINEETRARLGLAIVGVKTAWVVGGGQIRCQVAEPVELHWKDRWTVCSPMVAAGQRRMLLGVIAMEDMDLRVNPVTGVVEGAHGERQLLDFGCGGFGDE